MHKTELDVCVEYVWGLVVHHSQRHRPAPMHSPAQHYVAATSSHRQLEKPQSNTFSDFHIGLGFQQWVCKRIQEGKERNRQRERERDSDRVTKSHRYEGLERGNTVQEHTHTRWYSTLLERSLTPHNHRPEATTLTNTVKSYTKEEMNQRWKRTDNRYTQSKVSKYNLMEYVQNGTLL